MNGTYGRNGLHRGAAAPLWLLLGACVAATVLALAQRKVPGCRESDLADWPAAVSANAAQSGEQEKRVFLTFDDGPSPTTEKILDVLAEKEVKATFFVIAAPNNEEYLPTLQRTVAEGHAVALHSCTHEYHEIYSSTAAYWQDIDALLEKISPYVAEPTAWLRFPGGSTNTVSRRYGGSSIMERLRGQAEKKGYHVLDWNVSAEDAVGGRHSAGEIEQNIIRGSKGKNVCVVLMHDTKATRTTADALGGVIDWYKQQGYRFCTVKDEAP